MKSLLHTSSAWVLAAAVCLLPGAASAAVNSWRSATAAEPSRVASFPVDGSSGTALENGVSPSFGGTLQTGVTFATTTGRTVGTQSTAQSASGRISLTKDPEWNFEDGTGTVEAFVYQTASAAYNPCYFSLRQDGGGGVRYSLHGDAAGNNLYLWNGTAVSTWPVSPTMRNRLCHVVMVFDGGNVTAFVNGTLLGSRANTLGSGMGAPAQIGASGSGNTEAWPGNIDEINLYADALPAAAISAHYQAWLSDDSSSPPAIISQPSSLSRADGQNANFSVGLAVSNGVTFRWQRDGVDIPGATSATHTLPAVSVADDGAQFRCILYNAWGGTVSASATLTVSDLNPPVLLSAAAPYSPDVVLLTFDEAVDLSGATFTVSGGNVTAISPGPLPGSVVLTVSGLMAGSSVTVTAQNVKDLSGNVLTSSGLPFTAAPPPVPAPIALVRPGREPPGPATRSGGLVISEINYHPAARADLADLEFVEIANTLPWAEDLTGFRLSGDISYSFPDGTTIPADGYLVVAADPAAMQTVYGLTGVPGPFTGALNNSGGTLRLFDDADAVVFEVAFDSGHPWQPAADGAGHTLVLARPSYGMSSPAAWDRSTNPGGSPGAEDPFPADPWRTVVLNEIGAVSAGSDFIELYNYSADPVDISGCTLSDNPDTAKFVIPSATVIAPGGFLAWPQNILGFGLKSGGDTVYFRASGSGITPGRVLDCQRFGPQEPGTSHGRWPDGAELFSRLRNGTQGGPNVSPAVPPAVISEICYHPPVGGSQPPFIEIANTAGAPLDLSGWRLRGGIRYDFPAGTTLPAGGQIAVTAFSGKLSRSTGERIRLERPLTVVENNVAQTTYPVVDEVTYGTGGSWGRDSDGGGSSLEKRDLHADGRFPGNWADSDESGESGWVTLTNTGILDNGQPGTPANRLEIMLLGAGEVLIDDVELVQGAGANLVSNPGFESGMTDWSADGTHAGSRVEPGTGTGGSAAMHLRATGRGDLAGNRLLGTLTASASVGSTRTLRARVQYLRGHPEILLRLHGGWLETTGNLLGNVIPGTPDAPNSRAVLSAGPAITSVTHLPVLPQNNQPVTVYARISTSGRLVSAQLLYRIDPAAVLTSVVLQPSGAGLYSAEIPAQTTGKLAAFTLTASDARGSVSAFPATPPAECLVRWGETQPAGNSLTSYRLWFTQATNAAWTNRLKNSNDLLNATFVAGDYRVIYNAGAMYSGSPFHTPGFSGPTGAACDYTVITPSDDRYLGDTDMIWAGPGTFGSDSSQIREQTAWRIARKMGVPALHRRFVNVIINGSRRGTVMEDTQQPNGDFLAEYFPGADSGYLYKAQDWIEYGDDGSSFAQLSRAVLASAKSAGQHKTATYRYRWAVRSSESGNAYAPFTELVDAFNAGASAADPVFVSALDPILDQDSWSCALAIQRIVGNWDTWGWSYGKNMYAYQPPGGQWALIPWDMDFGFGPDGSGNPPPDPATSNLFSNTSNYDGSSPGDPLATKFRTQPAFRRSYWSALLDAANGPMVPATANARIDLLATALRANGITVNTSQLAQVKTFVSARRNYILSQANLAYNGISLALTGSSDLTDDDGILTLTGTAPGNVKTFVINGVEYTPAWTSLTAWSLPLTLRSANNPLIVEARDFRGNPAGSFPVTITVTAPPVLPPVTVNEWMADNTSGSGFPDPADGHFDDWLELHNSGSTPVNLDGYLLSDNPADPGQFRIPPNTIIPAGGWLVFWADGQPEQSTATSLHLPFKLSAGGESLILSTPDGAVLDFATWGPQEANRSSGRTSDGVLRVAALTLPTPGRANVLTEFTEMFTGNTGFQATITTTPGLIYQLQTSPDLFTWAPAGTPASATGTSLTLTDPLPSAGRRFFRAHVSVAP